MRSGVGNSILKHLSQELREDLEIVSKVGDKLDLSIMAATFSANLLVMIVSNH